jgi:hypothetical protein
MITQRFHLGQRDQLGLSASDSVAILSRFRLDDELRDLYRCPGAAAAAPSEISR